MNSKLVWECLNKLDMLGWHKKIWILGVPNHIGSESKKEADEMARNRTGIPLYPSVKSERDTRL